MLLLVDVYHSWENAVYLLYCIHLIFWYCYWPVRRPDLLFLMANEFCWKYFIYHLSSFIGNFIMDDQIYILCQYFICVKKLFLLSTCLNGSFCWGYFYICCIFSWRHVPLPCIRSANGVKGRQNIILYIQKYLHACI